MRKVLIGKAAHEPLKQADVKDADRPIILKSTASRALPLDVALARYPGLADLIAKDGTDPKSLERAVLFTISDESRDRDNDRIKVSGWKISEYRKNPVVLWMHQRGLPPIGRGVSVFQEQATNGPRLRMVKQFTSQEENPHGFMIYNLVANGFLRAASVGFLPRKWERDPELPENEYGLLYSKQDLLESSVVTIPSNPSALAEARSFGIDISPLKPVLERALDGDLEIPFCDQASIEEAFRIVSPTKTAIVVTSTESDVPELASVSASGVAEPIPTDSKSVSTPPESTPPPVQEEPRFSADPSDLWTEEHIRTLSGRVLDIIKGEHES